MSKAILEKRIDGAFVPLTPEDAEALKRVKIGNGIAIEFKVPRNYQFLKKYMKLISFAFDNFEPLEGAPEKNFKRFRDDITILSGHYIETPRVDGSVRIEAKSVAFANMEEDEFNVLYDKTCTVLIKFVLKRYTRDDIDRVINKIAEFAA